MSRVRNLVSDQDKVTISDRELIDWINDAIYELSRILEYKQRSSKTDAVQGIREYDLSDDMITIYGVKYNGITLAPVNHNEYYQLTETSGLPVIYNIHGAKLWLHPTPNENKTDAIEVYYLNRPNAIINPVDYPDLPSEYHPRIVEYCISQAYMKDAQFGPAGQVKSEMVANTIMHLGAKDGNAYPHIRSVVANE